MTQQVLYRYLGTNGVIESPVFLEGIYSTHVNILTADADKILTNGTDLKYQVRCSDDEIKNWREINAKG